MKNRVRTNSIRAIKKTLPRFVSLIIMSMLGVFVFSGLQATAPDMLITLDNYLDEFNVYDIKIVSTMGLTEEDIDAIKNIEEVLNVEGSYSKDIIVKNNDKENVLNISSISNNINSLQLVEGRMPETANEIVVEPNMLTKNNVKIGDTIKLEDDVFINKEAIIVGTINSGLYFNNVKLGQKRGNTAIGAGTINYYSYMLPENFNQDYYSAIYINVKGSKEVVTSSDEYLKLIENVIDEIESIKEGQENLRYNNIYNQANEEILEKEEDVNNELKDAKSKLDDAKNELKDIKHPVWYIYDRTDYITYLEYIDDTSSITNLSKLFPTVFFAVAVLVSLISMNRMVEEDRQEIGTLKSLGFSNHKIMSKYLIFSLLATIIGGILGSILGLTIIPLIISNIYGLLFDVPNFYLGLNIGTTALSFIIILVCVCGTSVITAYKVLKEKPSELMRPKAPKNGKRVFLENIKFLWKHIKFSKKVTIRNLFRYKKRVLVTVFGIAGCTALMLCGFGIRDAIVDIANMQYLETYKFDAAVYTNNLKEEDISTIFNNENITSITTAQTITANVDKVNVNLFIVENDNELSKIVNLVDSKTKEIDRIETGKAIITDKLADLEGLKVGDTINLVDVNNNAYSYEISAIVKNYLEHFVYINQETFENSNQTYEPNIAYLNTKQITEDEQTQMSTELLNKDEIINVMFTKSLIESADNMLKSLNKVVVILIVLAALLSFVVLYNLSNININERKREIATLKVLGFYDKEVDNYITKENIILTILGIGIGLVLGYFLTKAVITTVEIEKARFLNKISFNSYLYATILSVTFTEIVNKITHFTLKKIDMIESLKSVE